MEIEKRASGTVVLRQAVNEDCAPQLSLLLYSHFSLGPFKVFVRLLPFYSVYTTCPFSHCVIPKSEPLRSFPLRSLCDHSFPTIALCDSKFCDIEHVFVMSTVACIACAFFFNAIFQRIHRWIRNLIVGTVNEIQRRLGRIGNMSIAEGDAQSHSSDNGHASGTDRQAQARKSSRDAEYKDDVRFPDTGSEQDLCDQIRKMDYDRWFYSEESSSAESYVSEPLSATLEETPSGDLIENWSKIHAKFMKIARRGTSHAGDKLPSKDSEAVPSGSICERDKEVTYNRLFPALPGERNLTPIGDMPITGETGVSWSLSYKRASLVPDRAEDELKPSVMRSDWFVNMMLRLDRETRELRTKIQKVKTGWGIDEDEFWNPPSDVEEYVCEAGSVVGYRWGHPSDKVSRWKNGLDIREWMGEKFTFGDWNVDSEGWTPPEEDWVADGPTSSTDSETWRSRFGASYEEEEEEEKEAHWKDGYYWQWYWGRWWTWYKDEMRTVIEGEWWTWDMHERVYLNEEGKVRMRSSADEDEKETQCGEEDDIASESDKGSAESYCTGDGIPGQWRE